MPQINVKDSGLGLNCKLSLLLYRMKYNILPEDVVSVLGLAY